MIVWPAFPILESARTWLLLRMYWLPLASLTTDPSVPVQQNELLMSFTLLPLVPSLMGGLCWAVLPAKARVAHRKTNTSHVPASGAKDFFITSPSYTSGSVCV